MFDSIGWGEILVLVIAGLFILGPERLPAAAAWLGKTVRQVKEYATGAREQLRSELGPEFDELRKPLEDLRGIRDLNPRRALSRQLFADDALFKPNGYPANGGPANGHPVNGFDYSSSPTMPPTPGSPPQPAIRPASPLAPGERPPVDPDAT